MNDPSDETEISRSPESGGVVSKAGFWLESDRRDAAPGVLDEDLGAGELAVGAPLEEGEDLRLVRGSRWDTILYCLRCHRLERHATTFAHTWYYSFLVGLTFGVIWLLGPFRCRCCTSRRWFRFEWMHPYRWW